MHAGADSFKDRHGVLETAGIQLEVGEDTWNVVTAEGKNEVFNRNSSQGTTNSSQKFNPVEFGDRYGLICASAS